MGTGGASSDSGGLAKDGQLMADDQHTSMAFVAPHDATRSMHTQGQPRQERGSHDLATEDQHTSMASSGTRRFFDFNKRVIGSNKYLRRVLKYFRVLSYDA